MQQRKNLNRILSIAALAMLFGAGTTYAQSDSSKDASGMGKESPGQMSSGGQSDTSSATSSGASGTSSQGTSGASSGASDATSQGAGGSSAQSTSGASEPSSTAAKSGGKEMSKGDKEIMRDLARSNLAEIEAGKLALSQSKNDEVKSFAQKMVDDHTQAQKDLEQLAQSKGMTLPTEPDRKHKAAMKKLSSLEGEKFDKQYMSQGGVKDHRDTHRMITRAQDRATDPELKELVTKMEPVISQHSKMAKDLQSGKGTATGSSMGPAGTSSSGGASGSSGSSDSSGGGSSGTSGASGTSGSSNSTGPGK